MAFGKPIRIPARAPVGPIAIGAFLKCVRVAALCVASAMTPQPTIAEPIGGSPAWDSVLIKTVQEEARLQASNAQLRRQSVRTLDDLQAFREHVRHGLLQALFEQEEMPVPNQPLRSKVVGKPMTLPDCTLTKLCYESVPGHWVTATLYVPHDVTYPVPGILCIADHSQDGKAAPYNQRQGRAFAERGYVALVIDYPDRGELLGGNDHFINGAQVGLTGLWSNTLFVTNAFRGIDYLISRRDLVDPARIGVTGTSGGGATTAMIAALDNRVVAAVPCCFLETFERAIASEYTSCPEYFAPGGITWPMEWADVLTVAIPRAVAPVTALQDSLFTQGGFDEGVNQAKKFYALADSTDRLRIVRTREIHSYTPAMREAAYFWFAQWLGAPRRDNLPEWNDRVREADEVQFTITDDRLELISTENLAVKKPSSTNLNTISMARGERFRKEKFDFQSDNFGKRQADDICDRVKNFFHPMTDFGDFKVDSVSIRTVATGTVEEIILESPKKRLQLPACWALPLNSPKQLLLYLHGEGREKLGAEEMATYLEQDIAVLAVDLRGFGQLYPRASPWDKYPWCDISRLTTYGLWSLNSSVPHLQLADTQLALAFLREKKEYTHAPIYIMGVGMAAPIALFTTAIEPDITGVLGQGALVSYQDYLIHESPTYNQMGLSYGILKEFDLPVVLAAVADRIVSWSDIVDACGTRLSADQIDAQLQLAESLANRPESICTTRNHKDFAKLLRNEQK